ncbi:MAG: GTPase Era [Pseudomonadota bacterium]|nr:GTPase Era [Pseudomonadota bacterium]MEC7830180.1 GTPase Era [Pseudomonadota bacterium]MEC9382697.1 GTPase Era [Pseudomonadota bacterium]
MASKIKSNIVVSIVGPSNSGKSTFLNSTLGEKVSIVSRKVQTTRMGLRGILNNKNVQIIFIDTPGLFEAKTRFEKAMVENAFFNLSNADLVYFVIDGSRKLKNFEIKVLKYFKNFNKDSFLVINKIDLIDKKKLLVKSKEVNSYYEFKKTFMISAKIGEGIQDILDYTNELAISKGWLYPEDYYTDLQSAIVCEEITREKIFNLVHEEVPYNCIVKTENWSENKKILKIGQTIYVKKKNHKGIILGKDGSMVKEIGIASRIEMEKVFGKKIFLRIEVKVDKNWDKDPDNYNRIGLEINQKG